MTQVWQPGKLVLYDVVVLACVGSHDVVVLACGRSSRDGAFPSAIVACTWHAWHTPAESEMRASASESVRERECDENPSESVMKGGAWYL